MRIPTIGGTRKLCHLALLVALAIPGMGCSRGYLDRPFRTGRHADVVREFEADSLHRYRESALYRAGLAYAAAEPPVHSPERSRALLEELVSRFPES